MKDVVVIIDGNSLVNRQFYGIKPMSTKEGISTNAIFGFLRALKSIREQYNPKYLSVAFDLRAPTFRHKFYEDYKGTRKGMPPELAEQMPILKDALDILKIHRMELAGFEADDLIGTVANISADAGCHAIVITGDKDALQLVSDDIEVVILKKNERLSYDREMVFNELGVYPEHVIDFKGLAGDTSDNIPGIPSIGPKTAAKFLAEFTTVEGLIAGYEALSNKRHRGLIEEYADQAMISKKLATIMIHVPLELEMEEMLIGTPETKELMDFYSKYEFKRFLEDLRKESVDEEAGPVEVVEVKKEVKEVTSNDELKALVMEIEAAKKMYLRTISIKNDLRNDKLIGIGLNSGNDVYHYLDLSENDEALQILKPLLENPEIKKYGHELKQDILEFLQKGIDFKGMTMDTFIGLYLINPSRKDYDLSGIALEELGVAIKTEEELLGKGKKAVGFDEIDKEDLKEYVSNQLFVVNNISNGLLEELKEKELEQLFYDVELPLVEVLASLEYEGINVDQDELENLGVEIDAKLDRITAEIFDITEEEFNINSPKQLGVILFEKLGLKSTKKTKTGYSTSHDVLVKLVDKHPIVNLVMEFRTYSKLKSTYIDGLKAVINQATGRIHSSFNQTVTVTGRLSSTEPNMQNIPVRLDFGRKIRKVFIPKNTEYLFVDADYSQIELRVLAHMAEDVNLLKAFNEGIDVHAMTASQVFDIPVEEVTSLERSRAKEVNFGIVYGMSEFGLSESLKISRKEAGAYIEQYFAKYPNVKSFMDEAIEYCREHGYVKTLLNRRRDIPEIRNKNKNIQAFGERTAMNTPIQGTAADIIKIAMIKVFKEIRERQLKSKLILQVHDELIIDTDPDEVEVVKELLSRNMESAFEMAVPLSVDMNVGKSWYETK